MSSAIEIDHSNAVVTNVAQGGAVVRLTELPNAPPLRRRPEAGPARLSFTQERLWFLDQINPGDLLANLSRGERIRGALNTEGLKQALQTVVARHEVLRTTFAKNEHHAGTDGRPMQLTAETAAIDLTIIDLSQAPQAEREDKAREVARAEAQKPFDLTLGPLWRPVLIKLNESNHVLLLNTHRIVADEVSLNIFFAELWECHRAFVNRERSGLEDLPVQFADYATWQREWLQGDALKEQLDYWKRTLAGSPAVMELPTDRPRPAIQTSRGASVSIVLPRELIEQLRAISAGAETLFEVVLASFQVLLARHTKQTNIVVGARSENRDAAKSAALIGPLENALVLRTDLSNNPTFCELLVRVSDTARQAQAHRSIPFARLLEELPIERSLSHAPVFQILLNFGATASLAIRPGAHTGGRLTIEPFDFETGISPYDLTLNVVETPNQIHCRLEYNTDLFDAKTSVRMLGHFRQVLASVAADPLQPIGAVEMLTEAERDQIREWNGTERVIASESVVQLFEAQVAQTPESVAAIFNGEQLSYRTLNERANQLAHYLHKLGIGPDARVGICFERGLEMIAGVLATLKAGGAYVPLDPAYPQERLRFMLQDSQCAVLLTSARVAESLPATSAVVVRIDRETEAIAQESTANPRSDIALENLAYVIYTSGSTGWPKGVAMTHRALANVISWQLQIASGPATTLQFASLSFDVSFQELFTTWCSGGTLLLASDELRRDAPAMLRFLVEQKTERIFLPFVYLQHLAEAAELCGPAPETLREIITAGEQLEITRQI
ncbi:MAG TPA: condensation domain-containing protein, partial [Pyrinomonadaceae bacterium]|nr:condensation domain-containing protein [Pyrinomonadaceae bacterium]